jgi:hypothetical protein
MMICEFSDFPACVVTTICELSHGSNSTHNVIEHSFDDKKEFKLIFPSQLEWEWLQCCLSFSHLECASCNDDV